MNRFEFVELVGQTLTDRDGVHGSADETFEAIAKAWSEILMVDVTKTQVGFCMMALKMVRLSQNFEHTDNLLDLCGYAALTVEFLEKEKE